VHNAMQSTVTARGRAAPPNVRSTYTCIAGRYRYCYCCITASAAAAAANGRRRVPQCRYNNTMHSIVHYLQHSIVL